MEKRCPTTNPAYKEHVLRSKILLDDCSKDENGSYWRSKGRRRREKGLKWHRSKKNKARTSTVSKRKMRHEIHKARLADKTSTDLPSRSERTRGLRRRVNEIWRLEKTHLRSTRNITIFFVAHDLDAQRNWQRGRGFKNPIVREKYNKFSVGQVRRRRQTWGTTRKTVGDLES